ncbi:DUF2975 domain-containing protein [Exiguobacterium indicum]|uniref:DUF2975 domain-containing protein n=1 Tax=Exiguobacterium indicum TaxID=296995 RepID=UPI00397B1B27
MVGLLCIAGIGIPLVWHGLSEQLFFERPGYFVLIMAYIALIPVLFILIHMWRLLQYFVTAPLPLPLITSSIQSLKLNCYVISVMILCVFPIFFYIGQIDDAPGLILVGTVLILIPLTVGSLLACIQQLLLRNLQSVK